MSEASEPSDNSMKGIVLVVRLSRSAMLCADRSKLLYLWYQWCSCVFALLSGEESLTRRWMIADALLVKCACVRLGCDKCQLQVTISFSRTLCIHAGTVIAANTTLRQTTRATVALSSKWKKWTDILGLGQKGKQAPSANEML